MRKYVYHTWDRNSIHHIDRTFSNLKNIQLTKRIEIILKRKKELEALDLTAELRKTDEQVRKCLTSSVS